MIREPTAFPCRTQGRTPLFETQHEALRFMRDFTNAGHLKRCANLKIGIADTPYTGRRYGPTCERDSFEVQPEGREGLGIYLFRGCPSDCLAYAPMVGLAPWIERHDAVNEGAKSIRLSKRM